MNKFKVGDIVRKIDASGKISNIVQIISIEGPIKNIYMYRTKVIVYHIDFDIDLFYSDSPYGIHSVKLGNNLKLIKILYS